MTQRRVNDFSTDLAWSHDMAHDEALDGFYRRAFGCLGLVRIEKVEDLAQQRAGADKILHFASGRRQYVDEKKRRAGWQDILLEHYSNWDLKTLGWIEKPSITDWVVYAFVPANMIYLIPFVPLRMAWEEHKEEWIEKYKYVIAGNWGYRTYSVPVPPAVLYLAIQGAFVGAADFA